jgi:hypothetical protein
MRLVPRPTWSASRENGAENEASKGKISETILV